MENTKKIGKTDILKENESPEGIKILLEVVYDILENFISGTGSDEVFAPDTIRISNQDQSISLNMEGLIILELEVKKRMDKKYFSLIESNGNLGKAMAAAMKKIQLKGLTQIEEVLR